VIIRNNNLVAIAYKAGYCGSLIYTLAALSPEVLPYESITKTDFADGTAHDFGESWFDHLHDYQDSLTVSEDKWESYLTERSIQALDGDKLVLFRCHPNIAHNLCFIENLRVLYLTHCNSYIPERWAYEKVISQEDQDFYRRSVTRLLGNKYNSDKIDQRIKRLVIIKNFNHHVYSFDELTQVLEVAPHPVQVDEILQGNYNEYMAMCKYLAISAMPQQQFQEIIEQYNSKQWKRF
jgi:hypothetical protein